MISFEYKFVDRYTRYCMDIDLISVNDMPASGYQQLVYGFSGFRFWIRGGQRKRCIVQLFTRS